MASKSRLGSPVVITLLATFVTLSSLQAVAGLVEPVQIVLYGESLCPSCKYFVESVVAPLYDEGLNKDLFRFRYLAYGNARNQSDGVIVCQHGPDECSLNQVINCAQRLYPRQEDWFPYVRCVEASTEVDVQKRASQCAKTADVAWKDIHACAKGDMGVELEVQAAAATAALDPPHVYVPWVTVNGIAIGEGYQFLLTFVCAAYTGDRPAACSQPPPLYMGMQQPDLPAPSFRSVRLQKLHGVRSTTV